MSQFLGTYQNRLDAKGRTSVPAPFRAILRDADSATLILRPSIRHPCIEAWPETVFNQAAKPLESMDLLDEDADDLTTALYARSTPVEADREGRIVLPEALVAYAGVTDTVAFMGMRRMFTIWEPAAAARRTEQAVQQARAKNLTLRAAAP